MGRAQPQVHCDPGGPVMGWGGGSSAWLGEVAETAHPGGPQAPRLCLGEASPGLSGSPGWEMCLYLLVVGAHPVAHLGPAG